jgi:hypothetical protein
MIRSLTSDSHSQGSRPLNKNIIIVILAVALAAVAYQYQEEKNTTTIKLGDAKIEIKE